MTFREAPFITPFISFQLANGPRFRIRHKLGIGSFQLSVNILPPKFPTFLATSANIPFPLQSQRTGTKWTTSQSPLAWGTKSPETDAYAVKSGESRFVLKLPPPDSSSLIIVSAMRKFRVRHALDIKLPAVLNIRNQSISIDLYVRQIRAYPRLVLRR